MELQRESTSAEEMEEFAERILAEPEYREMVIAVLCSGRNKIESPKAGEELLQRLIGPPLQAKAIVTLFRTLQGAEYPEFCRDLFETAKILTALGAVEEGMILFTGLGIVCFGGAGLSEREREEVLAFLQAGRKVVRIPSSMQQMIDDYVNQVIEPKTNIYREFRRTAMEKIRNRDRGQNRLAKSVALMMAFIGLMIMHVAAFRREADQYTDVDASSELPNQAVPKNSSTPREPDKVHPAAPLSYARSICGASEGRTTFGFLEPRREVRVTCGSEDNEPILEITERSDKNIINCIDLGRDDIPDACGEIERVGENLRMISPPRENLEHWFQKMIREIARRRSH